MAVQNVELILKALFVFISNRTWDKGMQRQNPSSSIDAALEKPENEEQFYTASVQFLQKRLEEKKCNLQSSTHPRQISHSCCNLSNASGASKFEDNSITFKEQAPSLSMHQILPFPKSSKESFLTRLINTFRKSKRNIDIPQVTTTNDSKCSENMSSFKFTRCERYNKPHTSGLVDISEEQSNESVQAQGPSRRYESSSASLITSRHTINKHVNK